MSILSVTFHSTADLRERWEKYLNEELKNMADNLLEAEKYVLSTVETDMVREGQNTNLLLFFPDDEKRSEFMQNELVNISELIAAAFGDQVMIFATLLNPQHSRWD